MSTSGSYTPPAQASCPDPMTAAALRALRDAGGLDPQCHYVVNDFSQGTTLAGPNLVELHAVNASTLALEAKVTTPYDGEAWEGLYDIDRGTVGQLVELRDNLNNVVRDTTGTSPIVGTFPWGTALWSENYLDSVTLTAPATARSFQRNTVRDSTIDMTGWTSGSWTQSDVRASTVTTGGTFTMTNAEAQASTVTGQQATGSITMNNGTKLYGATLVQDAGSQRSWTLNNTEVRSSLLRGQGGTTPQATSIVASVLRGNTATGAIIAGPGDVNIAITAVDASFFTNAWRLDGAAGSSANIRQATFDDILLTKGAASGRLDITQGYSAFTTFDHQGTGQMIVSQARTTGGTVRTAAGSSGDVNVNNSTVDSGTVEVTSVRSLSLNFGTYVGQSARVTESGATASVIPSQGDRVDQARVDAGGVVEFATTAGTNQNFVTRTEVKGTSLASPAGRLRIEGTTNGAWVDGCRVYGGTVTITDASTDLNSASAFHDNQVDAGSVLTYTTGDGVGKQIRNNHVTGLSTMTLTGLTGTAGGGLADVFGMSVRGQSTLTVAGARVAGQPIRDCTVEQGSTLNIPANGATQRCRVAGGATLNGGAFVHFDTEVSLAATKTLTAANVNRLASKAFDDTV